jgi:hypothetical protein
MYVQEASESNELFSGKLSIDEAKYFAGRIDGDGNINASFVKKNGRDVIDRHVIISSSTDHKSIERLKQRLDMFKTSVGLDKKKSTTNDRDAWKLRLSNSEIVRFLEQIQPYLKNKDRHAVLMLRICKGLDIDKSVRELDLLNERGKQNNIIPDDFIERYKSKLKNKSNQPKLPRKTYTGKVCKEPAYLAGSVDTDGGISMAKRTTKSGYSYHLAICANYSSKEFYSEEIKKMFYSEDIYGSSVNKGTSIGQNTNNNTIIYINKDYHSNFLKEIMPSMDTRLPQAETAMRWIKGRISDEDCYQTLKRLNQRGKLANGESENVLPQIEQAEEKFVNVNIQNYGKIDKIILNADTRQLKPKISKKKSLQHDSIIKLDEFGLN